MVRKKNKRLTQIDTWCSMYAPKFNFSSSSYSHKRPYLILFYSDWCYTCLRIEPIWSKLTAELDPVGFGIATVHTEHEKELTRKIGAKELPHIILLIEGRIIHYKGSQISSAKILEFIRRKFPYKLVESVHDTNVDLFLDGWTDNR